MCGRFKKGFVCEHLESCKLANHCGTVRQGTRVLAATVTQLSPHGACIDLAEECTFKLGTWIVLSDSNLLRGGCDARIIGIEGRRLRLNFDPGFVMAMAHFGHLTERRAAHQKVAEMLLPMPEPAVCT